jgi:hypothetical protein
VCSIIRARRRSQPVADEVLGGRARERPTYRLFGISMESDLTLAPSIPPGEPPVSLRFRLRHESQLPAPPPQARSIYESPHLDSEGQVRLQVLSDAENNDLRFGRRICFSVGAHEVECCFTSIVRARDIEVHLLGAVLSLWLERRGLLCIHSSAVVTPEGAIGFLAPSGGGKSVLAALLVRSGFPLLTDDVLAAFSRQGRFWGRASYPQMRFWPREAEIFTGRSEGHDRVHPESSKLRVSVGERGFGAFHAAEAPLRALYLPARRAAGAAGGIEIEPIRPRDALIELVRESFVAHLVAAAPWARDRLGRLAAIAAAVPLRRLTYPSGFDRLPEVREAILDDMATLSRDADAGGPE